MVPSDEQQQIINTAMKGHNIVVDAVAGSGKTTTILSIAKALPNKSIIQVTFNSQLKIEVREKVKTENLSNINVHTYHSIATNFYDSSCWNDGKMLQLLESNMKPKLVTFSPDVIIIDEAQDMTLLYFRMVKKFMSDFCDMDNIQIIIMGDRYQSVYSFMQADLRFLTLASELWNRDFKYMTLCESYRLTEPIAWFVNNAMVKQNRIVAKRSGVQVDYHIAKPFQHTFLNEIIIRIKTGSLKPEDIFILCASLKSANSPAKSIENKLVECGIPVHVPLYDDSRIDDDITRGKVVFATFPSSKGRERKVVVVLGFDKGYFDFFAKNDNPLICPSSLYVAVTRAKEKLVVVGNSCVEYLPFLNMDSPILHEKLNIYGARKTGLKSRKLGTTETPLKHTTPVDLVRFLKQDVVNILTPLIEKLFGSLDSNERNTGVNIPSKIKGNKNQYEDVCDINGIVIPVMWESTTGSGTLHHHLLDYLKSERYPKKIIQNAISKLNIPCIDIPDYLKLCNVYQACCDGYIGRLAQIKTFDWLTKEIVSECHKHLDCHVSKEDILFEHKLSSNYVTPFGDIEISGRVDAISQKTLWEFKCVDVLTMEHCLQLVIYAWMYKKGAECRYKLLNIRTGCVKEMIWDSNITTQIVDILIDHKWATATTSTDEEFISSVKSSQMQSSATSHFR